MGSNSLAGLKKLHDFYREKWYSLEDNEEANKSIESYRDLTIYSFVIESSVVSDEEATIEVTLKVSGFEDGDDESTFKARISAVFIVSDLDIGDDFEDAEVLLDSLVLEKFYD
jgi:hypothetical protein